jgi:hypothetical protein
MAAIRERSLRGLFIMNFKRDWTEVYSMVYLNSPPKPCFEGMNG